MSEKEANVKIKRTDSFRFILPMLSESIYDLIDEDTKRARESKRKAFVPLINCYIADVDRPEHDNHIFVLYRFIGTKSFSIFEQNLASHPNFVEMYNPTDKHDMFVFSVPDDYRLEYSLFRSDRPKIFRRFDHNYKQRILKFLEPLFDVAEVESILHPYVIDKEGRFVLDNGKKIRSEAHEKRFLDLERELGVKIPRDIDNYTIPSMENETFNKLNFI